MQQRVKYQLQLRQQQLATQQLLQQRAAAAAGAVLPPGAAWRPHAAEQQQEQQQEESEDDDVVVVSSGDGEEGPGSEQQHEYTDEVRSSVVVGVWHGLLLLLLWRIMWVLLVCGFLSGEAGAAVSLHSLAVVLLPHPRLRHC